MIAKNRKGATALPNNVEPIDEARFEKLVETGNDAQNAEFFATYVRSRLIYNATDKAWFVYDGKRWARDSTGAVMRSAKESASEMLRLADRVDSQKARRYAVNCNGRRSLEAVIELAKSNLPAISKQFDRDPLILNVENGTLDLRTGGLRAHDPDDYLTKLSPVAYDPNATAPRWTRFLEEIFLGRADLIEYLQRLVGYFLTGQVNEHALPIFYGGGENGKSCLVEVLETLLGDYAVHVDVTLFLARREHGATPEIARLKGVRFAPASETPEGGRLAENLVKSLTGGDRITARHLYGEVFEFEPTAKFVISTNHKPVVRGDDHGLWRRLKLLPFDAKFEGAARDPHLPQKLKNELPGILVWAVAGCQRWLADGLQEPKAVTAATADYRSESDAIGAFLADRCIQRDDYEVRATHLAAEYKRWCADGGEKQQLTVRQFYRKLRDRGFDDRDSNGATYFLGIGLRASREEYGPGDEAPDP